MKFFYIFITCLIITGCAQYRFNRLIKLHPELLNERYVIVKDTIIQNDTFIIKERIDTFVIKTDTVIKTDRYIIEKNNETFIVRYLKDTIIVKDTVYYKNKVQIITEKKNKIGDIIIFCFIIIVFFIMCLVLLLAIKKFIKTFKN